jgi:hypothetical protein
MEAKGYWVFRVGEWDGYREADFVYSMSCMAAVEVSGALG